MKSVRQATLDLFRKHGLTTWFGNRGSSEPTLLEDFPDDFRYVLGLQDMVPVGMADAYAQVTGRPAVVNVHTAPGMGTAQGALYNAFVNGYPRSPCPRLLAGVRCRTRNWFGVSIAVSKSKSSLISPR